jgi:hypothetical protein
VSLSLLSNNDACGGATSAVFAQAVVLQSSGLCSFSDEVEFGWESSARRRFATIHLARL